jgi:hypothetical protein
LHYKQVFLFDRLQTKLEDLNPQILLEGLRETLCKLRLVNYPTLIENNHYSGNSSVTDSKKNPRE